MKKTNKKKYMGFTALLRVFLILLLSSGIITAQQGDWQGYTHSEIDYQWEDCDTILQYRAGDDVMYSTSLPFDFRYCDMTKYSGTTLYVGTNGRLSWTDTSSDYTPTETEFKSEQDIAVSWIDMGAYGSIYQCNLGADESNERTVIFWDDEWYSGDNAIFQVVLFKNGDIIINYADMSNASTAGQTGQGTVYKGISKGDNSYWTLNNWNNIDENLNHKSFKYGYQGTSPTTSTSTSTTSSSTTTTTPTTTTTIPSCIIGADCSTCSGWVNVGPLTVRDDNNNEKYDQICCSATNTVGGIFAI